MDGYYTSGDRNDFIFAWTIYSDIHKRLLHKLGCGCTPRVEVSLSSSSCTRSSVKHHHLQKLQGHYGSTATETSRRAHAGARSAGHLSSKSEGRHSGCMHVVPVHIYTCVCARACVMLICECARAFVAY